MYVISRIAKRNTEIKGRTLYLSTSGLWTLDKSSAKKFGLMVAAGRERTTIKKTLGAVVEPYDAPVMAD